MARTQISKARKSREQLKEMVISTDPLKDYKNTRTAFWGELIIQGLPPWYLWIGKAMMDSDPLVRFAMNIRNAMLMPAEITIKCNDPTIKVWLQKQWDFIWNHHRLPFTSAKEYGFSPLQLRWKEDEQGMMSISDVKDYAVEDSKCLLVDNEIKGMMVRGIEVFSPQAMWMTFGSRYSQPYGNGILRRMYPAWFEKWMNHGAKRLLQLRMIKDAYIGDIFWYPPNQLVSIPNGDGTSTEYPWRDIFREMGENRLAGNVMTLPRLFDDNGNPTTDYTPPQDTGGGSQIFEWLDLLDMKILQAADVSREIIEAAETGSGFSGRSIPFLTTLSVCNDELIESIKCFRRPMETAIWLNWGKEPDFEIIPTNLVESFTDDIAGSPMGGGAMGGQSSQMPPQQQSAQLQMSEDSVVSSIRELQTELPNGLTKLMPGYGYCWWLPEQKWVHLVSGDSDSNEDVNPWIKALKKIPGISKVTCEAEYIPKEMKESGVMIPSKGKRIYSQHSEQFKERDWEFKHSTNLDHIGGGAHIPSRYFTSEREEHVPLKKLHYSHDTSRLDHEHVARLHEQLKGGEDTEAIHVIRHRGRLHIVDGRHRAEAHKQKGNKEINAHVLNYKDLPDKQHWVDWDHQHSEQFDEHSYSSTQFNIEGPLADEIRALGMQIPDVDLAEDGRENQSHITLLFGIK